MTRSLRLPALVALAGAVAALLAGSGSASAQEGTRLLGGPVAAGGSWTLSIRHQSIGSVAGVCLDLGATLADGNDAAPRWAVPRAA